MADPQSGSLPAALGGLAFGARWLWLILLPVVAAHSDRLSLAAAATLALWATASLAFGVGWAGGVRPRWAPVAFLAVDEVCGLKAIASTGLLASPL